ncbi:BQ5605_C006g04153 [Microbotryum silenes-dioicae]|uniref:ATP-dependent DNA helicase n=1 Tax=Microbotryum silenes-dioicae TaxID=796604 RepID=A0A2X0MA95_9BASI|nr:BQ5605_C006g04153 [Microbotryum silenes-dioicae]
MTSRHVIVDFVDAPGGTGEPFLEETVLARIRSEGTYALAVASSDIAALLLPKGSTAHSRFKIPIGIFDVSTCKKQEQRAELWDEAPMQHRLCFQLVDRMLQDVRSGSEAMPSRYSTARFGGVTVVLHKSLPAFRPYTNSGTVQAQTNMRTSNRPELSSRQIGLELATPEGPGSSWKLCNKYGTRDPKQCLPVIFNLSPAQMVDACFMECDFWGEVEVLLDFVRLRIRMDNSKNTDSCTTSRRSEGQQRRRARASALRSGPTQFFAEPCLYRINIDESFYFQKI